VNSNEDIKKQVELLRKSEQLVKSYRTTSNIQIDEISNTDNDDVVIDEKKNQKKAKKLNLIMRTFYLQIQMVLVLTAVLQVQVQTIKTMNLKIMILYY